MANVNKALFPLHSLATIYLIIICPKLRATYSTKPHESYPGCFK